MTIERVTVHAKGIPTNSDAMQHVAQAFGFQSLTHMNRVLAGQSPSAFEEASAFDHAQWKNDPKARRERERQERVRKVAARTADKRLDRRLAKNRKLSEAARKRWARERAEKAAAS